MGLDTSDPAVTTQDDTVFTTVEDAPNADVPTAIQALQDFVTPDNVVVEASYDSRTNQLNLDPNGGAVVPVTTTTTAQWLLDHDAHAKTHVGLITDGSGARDVWYCQVDKVTNVGRGNGR